MAFSIAFAAPVTLQGSRSRLPVFRRRTPTACAAKVQFPGLRASRFQHPVDVRATRMLRSVPTLEPALRALLSAAESSMILDGLASGVRVGPAQMPSLHKTVADACAVLDMRPPELYVRQNPVPNAYTLAFQGRRPFIVIHSSLLELLTEDEVKAVVAHELGHLKAEHGVWVSMANLIVLLGSSLLGPGPGRTITNMGNALILRWQRAAELTCDRAALLVVQDPKVVISALMKLAGGSPRYASEMDVDEYLAQAEEFDQVSETRLGRLITRGMAEQATHPIPILRVRELKRWSESNHFRTLVGNGRAVTESS